MLPRLCRAAKFCLCLTGAIVFLVGLHSYLFEYEENHCEMTYMFEDPEYLEVTLRPSIKKRFPKYKLFLYGEGIYARRSRGMQLSGIPVLFVPGNAGSHKQVRSLASVALRKAESKGTPYHFNFFSVDFNEELGGLYGGFLEAQAEFVSTCIDEILDGALYRTVPRRSQIVLIGHSVGGLHTRFAASQKRKESSGFSARQDRVAVVIDLASPNNAPVFAFDMKIAAYYEQLNGQFVNALRSVPPKVQKLLEDPSSAIVDNENETAVVQSIEKDANGAIREVTFTSQGDISLTNVTFVSIGGGARDVLVPHRFTPFFDHRYLLKDEEERKTSVRVKQYKYSLSTSSSAIRNVWASTDHRCIVWCKQLVMRLADTLFDLVDTKSSVGANAQIDSDPERRFGVMEKAFRTCESAATRARRLHSLLKPSSNAGRLTIEPFDNPNARFISRTASRWLYTTTSIQAETIILTPLRLENGSIAPFDALFNQARSSVALYACTADGTNDTATAQARCSSGLRIDEALLCDLPPAEWRFGSLVLESSETEALANAGFTHIAFRIAATRDELDIRVDREPSQFVVSSSVWSMFKPITVTPPIPPSASGSSASSNPAGTVVFNRLRFPSLSQPFSYLEAYRVEILATRCRRAQKGLIGTARFVAPRCAADQHTLIWQPEATVVNVYAPANCLPPAADDIDEAAYLDVIVDPECAVEIQISFDLAGFIAQLIRFHASGFYAGLVVASLLGQVAATTRRFLLGANFCFILLHVLGMPLGSFGGSVMHYAIAIALAYSVNEALKLVLGILISVLQLLCCLRCRRRADAVADNGKRDNVTLNRQSAKMIASTRVFYLLPLVACAVTLNSTVSFYLYVLYRIAAHVCNRQKRDVKFSETLMLIYCAALFAPVGIVWLQQLRDLWLSGAFANLSMKVDFDVYSRVFAAVPLAADCWKWHVVALIVASSVSAPSSPTNESMTLVAAFFTLWFGFWDIPYLIPTALSWSYIARFIGSFLN